MSIYVSVNCDKCGNTVAAIPSTRETLEKSLDTAENAAMQMHNVIHEYQKPTFLMCDECKGKITDDFIYPASTQALFYGEKYARYIEMTTREHVEKGYAIHELEMAKSLGEMYIGNDGD